MLLEAIRKRSGSIVVKALMMLLILSFAAWGIGDYLRRTAEEQPVAVVGDVKISRTQYDRELQSEMRRLQSVLGAQFGREQAQALGLQETVLRRMINETLFDLGAKRLGIAVSDAALRATIEANPAFRGLGGTFDRQRFQQLIQNAGFTEDYYLNLLRAELSRQQLLASADLGTGAPATLIETIYRQRNEKRTIQYLLVEDQAMPAPPEPDEAALVKHHEERKAAFTAPEYRSLTVVSFNADELAKEMKVSDEELKDAFEARANEFQQPERRTIQQIRFKDEADAKRGHDMLKEGRDFLAVAKEVAGMAPEAVNLGTLIRQQVLDELAGPAFAAKEGDVTAPVKSPLGWHILRVAKIEAARQQTLDQVRDGLIKIVAREKAIDGLINLANRIEDALGGGARLEEVAQRFNLKIDKIPAIDGRGLDPSGKPADGVPIGDNFLAVAFATPEGSDSPLTESGQDGYFIVRVDKVAPPALKPLSQVRDQVLAAARAERRAEAAKAVAEALVEKLRAGGDFKALAAERNAPLRDSPALTRRGGGDLPAAVIETAFKLQPNEAAVARGDKAYYVLRLQQVAEANPGADAAGVAALKSQFNQSIQSDLQAQLAQALRQRLAVSINQAAVDRLTQ